MNKILSLFSGAGGIDIGFHSNSFQTYAAVDNWEVACNTLEKNKISKNIICSDIKVTSSLNELDILLLTYYYIVSLPIYL